MSRLVFVVSIDVSAIDSLVLHWGPQVFGLEEALPGFRIPTERDQNEIIQKATMFVNDRQNSTSRVCKKFEPRSYAWKLMQQPRWFNPDLYIICLKLEYGHRGC
jgi:hypothetical protein